MKHHHYALIVIIALLGGIFSFQGYNWYEGQKTKQHELVGLCDSIEEMEKAFDRMTKSANSNRFHYANNSGLSLKDIGEFNHSVMVSKEIQRTRRSVTCEVLVAMDNEVLWPHKEVYLPFELVFNFGYKDGEDDDFNFAIDLDRLRNQTSIEMATIFVGLINY